MATDLSKFLTMTADYQTYQHTLESIYRVPLESYLSGAVGKLNQEKRFVPTDENLQLTGRTREETSAEYDHVIALLKDAYGQLAAFQSRAKALHQKVLPELQEKYYKPCADRLAAICTEVAGECVPNAARYFSPHHENEDMPTVSSEAFGNLRRTVLVGLRTTQGARGISDAGTVQETYLKDYIAEAIQIAQRERADLEKHSNKVLLREFDAWVAVGSPKRSSEITEEAMLTAGEEPKRRSLLRLLFDRK